MTAASLEEAVRRGALSPGRRACFDFEVPGRPSVRIHAYAPPGLSSRTRIVVIMHGMLRNADEYIDGWLSWAAATNHFVLAPTFDSASWPRGRSYSLGNVFSGADGGGVKRREEHWSFTVVEALHDRVRAALGLEDRSFLLWGHSAGGQFVHRFLLFRPGASVRAAVAAGCGWFTLPDLSVGFPYGLRHPSLGFAQDDALRWVRRPLILMRGTLDRAGDRGLRTTPAAQRQGRNRYERAGSMARAARRLDPGSRWRLVDVPGVGHDWTRMAPVAQALFEELADRDEVHGRTRPTGFDSRGYVHARR